MCKKLDSNIWKIIGSFKQNQGSTETFQENDEKHWGSFYDLCFYDFNNKNESRMCVARKKFAIPKLVGLGETFTHGHTGT